MQLLFPIPFIKQQPSLPWSLVGTTSKTFKTLETAAVCFFPIHICCFLLGLQIETLVSTGLGSPDHICLHNDGDAIFISDNGDRQVS